jgi:hypothetical protein
LLDASFYQKISCKKKGLSFVFRDVQRGATLRNAGFVPRTTIFYEARDRSAS